jgi:drug/metabolite transporter (DMT)-like permease
VTLVDTSLAAAAADRRAAFRGILFVLGSVAILPVMDAVGKLLTGVMPPGEITAARLAVQALVVAPVLAFTEGWRGFLPHKPLLNMLRGAMLALSGTVFFTALRFMPLADALAVFFIEPLILTVLSALVQKEHVGWHRRIAVAVGFVGAVVVIRPSYQLFGPAALLPAVTALVFALYLILNRRLGAHDSALSMQFSCGLAGAVVMGLVLAAGTHAEIADLTPVMPGLREWGLLGVVGAVAAAGHLMLIQAFRLAPASLLAPFQYLEIVGATILGYAMFRDFPDAGKLLGIFIIIASGIYVFWRENLHRSGVS